MKRILTVAGSDSGGGAGIQADIKAITVLGGYGLSVITALTAQNTVGVQGIHQVPPDFIRRQMDSVLSDIGADAVKTGMLATREIVLTVADGLAAHKVENLVVDPVMVAASGDPLLSGDAVEAVKEKLFPLAFMVTPNLHEASLLCGFPVTNLDQAGQAARKIFAMGPRYVLIKGGHLEGEAVDTLYDGQHLETFRGPMIDSANTHGTGCTLSAALATFLAQGHDAVEAVRAAKNFITAAIKGAFSLGAGHGPTNPYVIIQKLKDRETVLADLRGALYRLLREPLGRLIPEIRSNLGYALDGAADYTEVAAIPGRISQINERLVCQAEPAFGASRHVAKVILAANRHDPLIRSAINLRYSPEILEACRRARMKMASFDRADEPRDVKEREGSSLEWGTSQALTGLTETPDVIFDAGDVGKEPIVRVLGRGPLEVVDKVIEIDRCL